jgi:opacity protein-like surface antigen
MRRSVLVVTLLTGLAGLNSGIGWAQASAPEVEIHGGLTKLWGHTNGFKFDDGAGEVSVTGYFNRSVGLEGEFAEFSYSPPNAPAYGSHFSFLFGPHFAYHGNRWVNPYAHVLLGITRGDATGPSYSESGVIDRSAFTFGIGAGVDVKMWRILWLRPIQADYLRESFPGDPYGLPPFSRALEHNLRLSAGFVLRVGSRQSR